MSNLRFPISLVAAIGITVGLFGFLQALINVGEISIDVQATQKIEFQRMRRDTEVATKRDEKIERERPPPTPEMPRMTFSTGGIDNNVATLTPVVDARGAMTRMSMEATKSWRTAKNHQ